jgi:hypothetical protein
MPNTVQITAIPGKINYKIDWFNISKLQFDNISFGVGGVLPTGINGFPATFGLGQFGGPGVFGGLGGLGGFGGLEGFGGLGGLGGQGGLSSKGSIYVINKSPKSIERGDYDTCSKLSHIT